MPTDHKTSIKDPVASKMILKRAIPKDTNFSTDKSSFNNIKPPNAVSNGQTI